MATEEEVYGDVGLNGQRPRFLDHALNWYALYGDEEAVPVRWLAEPIIAEGRGHALYALAKVGKSLLALALAAAVATGRPFLGRPRSEPEPVLYVDYEMTPEDVLGRLEEMGYDDPAELDLLHYVMLPDVGALDDDTAGAILVEDAVAVGASLVVIDTTGRAVGGSENDSDTYLGFYRSTGKRLKASGIAWLRLDHAGKDVAKGQRGSSAKNDDVDLVWYLETREGTRPDGRTRFRLTATHRRMGWVPASVGLLLAGPSEDLGWTLSETTGDPPGTDDALEAMESLGIPPESSVREAKRRLREAGVRSRDVAIQAATRRRRDRILAEDLLAAPMFGDEPL